MTPEELHEEIETYEIVWTGRALLHALVDLGRVTELVCQHPDCILLGVAFTKKNARGARTGLTFDHIVPRREGGSHLPENLRIVHTSCNSGWRKGIVGSFLTEESREVIRQKAIQQHVDGRGPDYSDPRRSSRISEKLAGRMSDPARRGWETRRARLG